MVVAFATSLGASLVSLMAANLLSLAITEIGHIANVNETLTRLAVKAQRVQTKIDQLSRRLSYSRTTINSHDRWDPWVQEVTMLCYEVDDIIDDVELAEMKRKRRHQRNRWSLNPQLLISWLLHPHHSRDRRRRPPVNDQTGRLNITKRARKIILFKLRTFGLPRKINYLLAGLNHIEVEVDGMLNNYASQDQNRYNNNNNNNNNNDDETLPLTPGRQRDKDHIKRKLLMGSTTAGVSVVGMAGLGKTALVRSIVDDDSVQNYFDAIRWVLSPTQFKNMKVLGSVEASDQPTKTLLVLDDLEELVGPSILEWEELKSRYAIAGSATLLITTRDPRISWITETAPYYLKRMLDEDCGNLIRRKVGPLLVSEYDLRLFNEEVSCIAKKCMGLPLMATIVGDTMRLQYNRHGSATQAISYFAEKDLWELVREDIFCAWRFKHPNLLPVYMNKLLAYFTLFPQEHMLSRDGLLQLWMAEGFIQPENWTNWDQAEQHFDDILPKSMVELSLNHNEEQDSLAYQVNEVTQRFSKSIASNMCFRMDNSEQSYSLENIGPRHLSICCQKLHQHTFPDIVKHCKRLRTFLMLQHGANIGEAPHYLVRLVFLRVLDLSHSCISTIPESIENLKHLRYLDFSYTSIKKLPDSTCELIGLRVLKLIGCSEFQYLPDKIGNLVNLVRLDLNLRRLCSPPRRLGRLTNLQTLDEFSVKKNKGNRITELKHMNALQGPIRIKELENVSDEAEAVKAALHRKTGLTSLLLEWTEEFMPEPSAAENILTKLQPYKRLAELRVTNYNGLRYPSWISDSSSRLRSIHLHNNPHCTKLPQLWKLRFLKALHLESIPNLQHVGRQFFGDLNEADRFISLERLEIHNMPELASWENMMPGDFPSLKLIKLVSCPELIVLSRPEHLPDLIILPELCPNFAQAEE